jgi:hypothetical protein
MMRVLWKGAGTEKDRLSSRTQGNLSDIFEVSNGKCRKKEKEEDK